MPSRNTSLIRITNDVKKLIDENRGPLSTSKYIKLAFSEGWLQVASIDDINVYTTRSTPKRLPNDLLEEIDRRRGKKSLASYLEGLVRSDDTIEVSKSTLNEISERLSKIESVVSQGNFGGD